SGQTGACKCSGYRGENDGKCSQFYQKNGRKNAGACLNDGVFCRCKWCAPWRRPLDDRNYGNALWRCTASGSQKPGLGRSGPVYSQQRAWCPCLLYSSRRSRIFSGGGPEKIRNERGIFTRSSGNERKKGD